LVGFILYRAAEAYQNGLAICSGLYFDAQKANPPTKQSISEARTKISWKLFEWLLVQIGSHAKNELWKGHRVRIVDGTQIRLPHTPALIEEFGRLKSQHGFNHYPCAQLVILKDGLSYQPLKAHVGRCDDSEKQLAKTVFAALEAKDVVLLDRGLGGQEIYRLLCEKGVFFIHRVACKGDRIAHYLRDFIKSGETSRVTKVAPLEDKHPILLRLLRGQLPNGELIIYVTNLIDENCYLSNEVHDLYSQRWSIETSIGYLKTTLNLEGIKAKTINSVRQDIFAHLIVLALSSLIQEQTTQDLNLDTKKVRPSLKNVFAVLKEKIPAIIVAKDIRKIWQKILTSVRRIIWVKQHNRTHPRHSMQPQSRWIGDRYRRKKALT
jgi:hypothetical protein